MTERDQVTTKEAKTTKKWSRAPEVTRDVLCQALRQSEDSLVVAQKYAEVGGYKHNAKALGKLVVEVHQLLVRTANEVMDVTIR